MVNWAEKISNPKSSSGIDPATLCKQNEDNAGTYVATSDAGLWALVSALLKVRVLSALSYFKASSKYGPCH
jgi:hypothetical protein